MPVFPSVSVSASRLWDCSSHRQTCIDTVAGQERAGQGRGRSRSSSGSRREPGGQGQTHSPERKLDIFWRGKSTCCVLSPLKAVEGDGEGGSRA